MTNSRWHDEQTVKGLRKMAWASIFRFPFDVSMSVSPCLYVSMSPCLRVSMSPCLHVSMFPCLHVPMSPCLHVSMSSCLHVSILPCLHVFTSPCLHVFMSPCLHVSLSPCFRVFMSPCPCLYVSGIHKRKTELMENSNFRLFYTNGKRKRQISDCLMKMKRKTDNCISWSAIDKQ